MDLAVVQELLHQAGDPAGVVEVQREVPAGGLEQDQVRHPCGGLGELRQVERQPGFGGDGRKVQAGVGGAAHGHVHGQGVFEGGRRQDVPRQDVLLVKLHDLPAGPPGDGHPGPGGGRGEGVVGDGHAEGLGQDVHAVGGPHHGAGARSPDGHFLEGRQLFGWHLAPFHQAFGLHQVVVADALAVEAAGVHGPAGDEERRDVQPGGRHQHTGGDLVAVGQQHHGVEGVGGDHDLDRVGDELAAGHGHAHARMSGGQAIADRDGGELERGAAGLGDAELDGLAQGVQVDVAGHELVEGVHHGHQGLVEVLRPPAHGIEQRAVGGAIDTFGHDG